MRVLLRSTLKLAWTDASDRAGLVLPCAARSQSSFMGLGDLVAYTFVGLIVAVFIFQLVDTAQTAKRKLVAKKND